MSKFKQMLQKLKLATKNKKVAIPAVLALLLIIFISLKGSENGQNDYEVKRMEFVKSVSVSGKVISMQTADLSFETSGTVASVNKKVGDRVYAGEVIASLNASELYASRDKATANLLAERAELAKLQSEESGNTEVTTNKRLVVNSILDAYTQADDAIRNKVDQFYEDGRTTAPKIKYTFSNYFSTKDQLNDARETIEKALVLWQSDIMKLTAENYNSSDRDKALTRLMEVRRFLDQVSFAVNSFDESSSLSQATIEKYRSDISQARVNINETMSELTAISDDLRSSVSDIPVKEANVRATEAEVRSIDAQIAKMSIRAPFSGIITLQDAKVGEAQSSNVKVASVNSADYEVEVFVPEVNIQSIALGDTVQVDLDALPGKLDFDGVVTHIDPAETERDGVSNYKVKIKPSKLDPQVKPGMTADVIIETERRANILVIPQKFMVQGSSTVTVRINDKESEEREIILGETDGKGNVEVLGGLEEGEVIILPAVK